MGLSLKRLHKKANPFKQAQKAASSISNQAKIAAQVVKDPGMVLDKDGFKELHMQHLGEAADYASQSLTDKPLSDHFLPDPVAEIEPEPMLEPEPEQGAPMPLQGLNAFANQMQQQPQHSGNPYMAQLQRMLAANSGSGNTGAYGNNQNLSPGKARWLSSNRGF